MQINKIKKNVSLEPPIHWQADFYIEAVIFLLAFWGIIHGNVHFWGKGKVQCDLIQNKSNFTIEETEALRGDLPKVVQLVSMVQLVNN